MIAFVFPGQGAQRPGMGRPWVGHPSWELVEEASEIAGRDVARLLCDADDEELRQTRNSQLATFILSLVCLDAVERVGVEPGRAAGHSLGEYTALCAVGAVSFEDGVRLVSERGEAMQVAAEEHEGTMAAVLGLDDDAVEIACSSVDSDVWVANYNAPGQVVIAGSPEGIERAGEVARSMGAKRVVPLKVGGAFHTPYMAPARDRLRKAIAAADLRDPGVPVVANVDARTHTDADEWAGLLAAQLVKPVRWRASLHTLADDGVTMFCELGPGNVLAGLIKRTLPGIPVVGVAEPADVDRLMAQLAEPAAPAGPEGEHLSTTERVVVAPAAGVFTPTDGITPGAVIAPGQLLGTVGDAEVRSPWEGTLMRFLAHPGERLAPSQPVAWVRV